MSNANAKLAAALKPGQIVKMTGAEAGMGNVKSFMESQSLKRFLASQTLRLH